ncbi:MAG: ABC transporter ATP-binding protein [Dehalococcoidales bacterium]|nr:ABC transporter ATP-binding protein [Dehalococcoidales bacterium]
MNTPASPIVQARDVSVVLGGQKVLDIPSLEVMPGEVLVIIGPNGAGKTTLLLNLASLLKPASGRVLYNGQDVGEAELLKLRRRLAVVFQDSLLLNTTVWDNASLGLRLRGVAGDEIKVRTRKWLERFGIAALAQRQARTLSGGEARRVSLARAFVLEPEVLFLDEPFAGLDSPTRQALMEDFEGVLRETRVTTVMVTHDRNEALVLANRVAVLIGGRIRQIGTPDEVFSGPTDEEVATFIEAGNVLHGVVSSQVEGLASVSVGSHQLEVVSSLNVGTGVILFLRHEDITLSQSSRQGSSSARNRIAGKVTRLFLLGSQVRVTVDCGFSLVALITRRSLEEMGLAVGAEVTASFKASSIHLIPRR